MASRYRNLETKMDRFTVLSSISKDGGEPTIVDVKLDGSRKDAVDFVEGQVGALIDEQKCDPVIKETPDVSFLSFPNGVRVWLVISPV